MLMSDKEYVEQLGLKCPECKSEEIEGGSIQVDGGSAWQSIVCKDCGAGWNDIYRLVGFSEFEKGDKDSK